MDETTRQTSLQWRTYNVGDDAPSWGISERKLEIWIRAKRFKEARRRGLKWDSFKGLIAEKLRTESLICADARSEAYLYYVIFESQDNAEESCAPENVDHKSCIICRVIVSLQTSTQVDTICWYNVIRKERSQKSDSNGGQRRRATWTLNLTKQST